MSTVVADALTRRRQELQLSLAQLDGCEGDPVLVSFTQTIDARQVQVGRDLVQTMMVPAIRARFARDLAHKGLRPLDPWPAIQVRRFVWSNRDEFASTMLDPDAVTPPGMRELYEDEEIASRRPDLYQLHVECLAVRDTRTVEL
jgi:hypothetical protein